MTLHASDGYDSLLVFVVRFPKMSPLIYYNESIDATDTNNTVLI